MHLMECGGWQSLQCKMAARSFVIVVSLLVLPAALFLTLAFTSIFCDIADQFPGLLVELCGMLCSGVAFQYILREQNFLLLLLKLSVF